MTGGADVATAVVRRLTDTGATVATAESLTGGLVCARLTGVPGASVAVRGAVVAYATDLKHALLDVDAALLAAQGAVHPDVASSMAQGVRRRLGATWGVATTGVAGPAAQDGRPVGTVLVAVAGPTRTRVEPLRLEGDRAHIRSATVEVVLGLLAAELGA